MFDQMKVMRISSLAARGVIIQYTLHPLTRHPLCLLAIKRHRPPSSVRHTVTRGHWMGVPGT